jgi:hypothetical protein
MISDLNILILVKSAMEAAVYQDYSLSAVYVDRSDIWHHQCEGKELAVSCYPGSTGQAFRDKIVKRLRSVSCKLCLMKPFHVQDTPYSSVIEYVERQRLNGEWSENEIRIDLESYVMDTGEPLEFVEGEQKKKAQADLLIEIGIQNIKTFFLNQYKEPFSQIIVGNHLETIPIGSTEFRRWLSGLYFAQEGRGCNAEAMRTACDTLDAQARYKGAGEYRLQPRTAWYDGGLFYDLTDPEWRIVRVTQDGWDIKRGDAPLLFRRFKNQAPQVEPVRGGDIQRVFDFLNIKNNDDRILVLAWLVTAFIPDFPHPVLNLHGSQGSAKSNSCRILKALIDPGIRLVESMQKDETDLVRKIHNSWFVVFDNLHNLQQWQSDTLSRAVTGDGFSTRSLYTDNDEFILQFQRVVALNGINVCAVSPDLLDRSIIIELERIPHSERRTENELERAFAALMPGILGGVFDALVMALHLYPKIKDQLKFLPRMADFTIWGYTIAEAINGQGDRFIDAYCRNIRKQHEQVIENHPIAAVLLRFMADRDAWTGRAGALLDALEGIAGYLNIKITQKPWPQQPNTLMRRLNELKATLMECGIAITTWHTELGTSLTVAKISPVSSGSSGSLKSSGSTADDIPDDINNIVSLSSAGKSRPQASPDATDDTDDIFPLSAEEKKKREEIRERYIDL